MDRITVLDQKGKGPHKQQTPFQLYFKKIKNECLHPGPYPKRRHPRPCRTLGSWQGYSLHVHLNSSPLAHNLTMSASQPRHFVVKCIFNLSQAGSAPLQPQGQTIVLNEKYLMRTHWTLLALTIFCFTSTFEPVSSYNIWFDLISHLQKLSPPCLLICE